MSTGPRPQGFVFLLDDVLGILRFEMRVRKLVFLWVLIWKRARIPKGWLKSDLNGFLFFV